MGAAAVSSSKSFVGRERELRELRSALDDTDAGRGRLFLLSGEPGIGKTRLAEEIAREATIRDMRAVWGRSWEGGGAPAYWPWVQILRSLVFDPDWIRVGFICLKVFIWLCPPDVVREHVSNVARGVQRQGA